MTEVDAKPALEPFPITVTRYVCPFCHRSRSRRGPCQHHMDRCWKNPDLKGCKTCMFFRPGKPTGTIDKPPVDDKCDAGFRISAGLVTKCQRWKQDMT